MGLSVAFDISLGLSSATFSGFVARRVLCIFEKCSEEERLVPDVVDPFLKGS
jgi:hypothetical protein